MVEIKRFGKFLPHDTKIKVYHGSRKLFTRFSNEFNRTGNGKNVFGWGIYVSTDMDHASWFAMDYHWCYLYNDIVIDNKVYDVKSLHKSFDAVIDPYGSSQPDSLFMKLMREIHIKDILDGTVNKDLILNVYNLIAEYIDANNMPGRFLVREIVNKLRTSKNISFQQKSDGYIYECELSVGKVFTKGLTKTDIHFIKGQIRKEGIKEDIFKEDENKGIYYASRFYDNLVNYYLEKRHTERKRAERKASLFLHRCGYQAIECGGGEYVVIDINCLNINKTIEL